MIKIEWKHEENYYSEDWSFSLLPAGSIISVRKYSIFFDLRVNDIYVSIEPNSTEITMRCTVVYVY